eukprot:592715-Lingulodinium_polyedra.AAC.1
MAAPLDPPTSMLGPGDTAGSRACKIVSIRSGVWALVSRPSNIKLVASRGVPRSPELADTSFDTRARFRPSTVLRSRVQGVKVTARERTRSPHASVSMKSRKGSR